jgi:hypothetical protein
MEEVRVWTWRAAQLALGLAAGAIALLAWSSWSGAAPSQGPPLGTLIEPGASPFDPIVRPVSAVTEAAAPVVEHVAAPAVEQVVEPVAPTVEQVVEPVAPTVEQVVEPVVALAAPVAEAVGPVVQAVTGPVAEAIEPVVQPVAGPAAEAISPAAEPLAGSLLPTEGELLAAPGLTAERTPAGTPISVAPLAVPASNDDPLAASPHAATDQMARAGAGHAAGPAAVTSSPVDPRPSTVPRAPGTGTSLFGALAAAAGATGLTGLDLPVAVLGGVATLLALAALGARRTASAPHPEPSSLIVVPPG